MRCSVSCLSVLAMVALAIPVFASPMEPVLFDDLSSSWGMRWNGTTYATAPGATTPWNYPPGSAPPANTLDRWGTPVFGIPKSTNYEYPGAAGSVVFDTTGALRSITVNYQNPDHSTFWQVVKPGDLFLDVGSNGTWDYVARTPFFDSVIYSSDVLAKPGDWSLYSLGGIDYLNDRDGTGYNPYQVAYNSTRADEPNWTGFDVRDYHPWAMQTSALPTEASERVWFDGWKNLDYPGDNGDTGSSTWTFSGDGLRLSDKKLTIGFTVNCANDVLLGDVEGPALQFEPPAVPEPTSLAIWGLAALGAAAGAALRGKKRRGRWSEQNRAAIYSIIERGR